jgi:hypothetical protein
VAVTIEGEGTAAAAALCEVEGEQAAVAARVGFSVFGWWSGGTDELNYHTTLKRIKLAKCNILHNR